MDENRGLTMDNGRLNRAAKALSVAIELSAEILREYSHTAKVILRDYGEVVRCKECIYRGREDCAMFYRCNCGEQHTWETDNDFCSYGKRRE